MRKILLTICFFISIILANAQSPVQWTLHSSAAQIRNGFNNNFSYLYTNKADKTNPVIIGVIKISDGTNVTDSVALRSWVRSYVSTHGGSGGGSMVYPAAGIPLSNGTAWLSSISNNSNNWNTAYTDRNKWDGGVTGLAAATGRTSLGATTIGSAFFTLTNPGAITFPRINADNSVSTLSASAMATALGLGGGGVSDAAMRQAITDSLNSLRDNAIPIANVAVITADSATNKYSTKKQMRDYVAANGGTSGSILEAESFPENGNICINTNIGKLCWKSNGYWHWPKTSAIDSVAVTNVSTLTTGLINDWNFDQNSSTQTDAVGSDNLTVIGATYNATGKINKCLHFTSNTNVAYKTSASLAFGSNTMSVSFWVKFDNLPASSDQSIIEYNEQTGWTSTLVLRISSTGVLFFGVSNSTGTTYTAISTACVTTGQWYNVVCAVNGSNPLKIYVDGTDVVDEADTFSGTISTTSNWFGVGNDATDDTQAPTMWFDNLHFWSKALSSTEITELHTKENAGTTNPW